MKCCHKFFFAFILFFISSCENKSVSTDHDCKVLKFRPIYYEKGCHGNHCAYNHFLMLENFDDICFSQYGSYDFVVIADKYLDSVKTDTPVSSITFVRSFNFEITSDGSNDIPLLEHAVVDINYKESTWGNEVPEIVGVGYWIDGKRKGLDYIDVDARKLGRQNRVHH